MKRHFFFPKDEFADFSAAHRLIYDCYPCWTGFALFFVPEVRNEWISLFLILTLRWHPQRHALVVASLWHQSNFSPTEPFILQSAMTQTARYCSVFHLSLYQPVSPLLAGYNSLKSIIKAKSEKFLFISSVAILVGGGSWLLSIRRNNFIGSRHFYARFWLQVLHWFLRIMQLSIAMKQAP